MWMLLRLYFGLSTVWHRLSRPGCVCRSPAICSLPCRLQSKWALHLQMLPTLKGVGLNVMLRCLLLLSRAESALVVLRQWSLARRNSRVAATHAGATDTKLRTALTRRVKRQLPTPLPTDVATQVTAEASSSLVLIICRLLWVSCSLQLLL